MRTLGPGQSALLLLDVIAVLQAEGVEYAVIGAMAASVHGAVRASVDADALTLITTQRARELEQRFKSAGFTTSLRLGDLDDPIPGLLALADSSGNRVDLLIGLRGVDPDVLARAIAVPFQGSTLRIIGLEDFIAMKVFAGGPLDLADATAALATAQSMVDFELLRRLTKRYGSAAVSTLGSLLSEK
jgi:predicted nucleotidyltransferase